jgi:dolichol-phosphate mannosyltransferase
MTSISKNTFTVVMPQFNEETIICSFLESLKTALEIQGIHLAKFICIDDKSTDGSVESLLSLASSGFPLEIKTNTVNLGHGPTTVRALFAGLDTNSDFVLAIDGDGQFNPSEVAEACKLALVNDFAVLECQRINREEPVFRKLVSLFTRVLISIRTHRMVADANTPLRIYKNTYLSEVINQIPTKSLIPNLHMSCISRSKDYKIGSHKVNFLTKISGEESTMFGRGRRKYLPSSRFVKFCFRAILEWLALSPILEKFRKY